MNNSGCERMGALTFDSTYVIVAYSHYYFSMHDIFECVYHQISMISQHSSLGVWCQTFGSTQHLHLYTQIKATCNTIP